jgi:hypothetical protein
MDCSLGSEFNQGVVQVGEFTDQNCPGGDVFGSRAAASHFLWGV